MRTFSFLPIVTVLLLCKIVVQHSAISTLSKYDEGQVQIVAKLKLKPVENVAKPLPPTESYSSIRRQMERQRNLFRLQLDSAKTISARAMVLDAAGKYLEVTITNKMIPHWYGTPWSFDGYTETPGKGKIACGYFVSTVLSHSGFKLNRYKIAQQTPSLEVLTLHQKRDYIEYPHATLSSLSDSIRKNLNEGLYIFGQQFHVGFMLYKDHKISLIHSCYLGEKPCVTSENIARSRIMYDGSYIFFGEITTNKVLLEQWLHSSTIRVLTQ